MNLSIIRPTPAQKINKIKNNDNNTNKKKDRSNLLNTQYVQNHNDLQIYI